MAGFFGDSFDDPKTAAIMALAGGFLQGNAGAGFLGANSAFQEARNNALHRGLLDVQLKTGQAQLNELQRKQTDADAAREVLRDFYKNQGMPQSAQAGTSPGVTPSSLLPVSAQFGGGSMPAGASSAMSPTPQSAVTPKADVWQQYKTVGDQLAARGLVDQAQQYYGMAEKMRPKFGTEPRVMMGPNGPINVLVGEDGSTQVLPFGVKPQMHFQDLGGKVVAMDQNLVQNGQSFGKTMTPGETASNAVAWANNAATLRGQDMTDSRTRELNAITRANGGQVVDTPQGYVRIGLDNVSRPVTGADGKPLMGKRADQTLTEDQGKATGWLVQAQNAWKNMQASGLNPDGSVKSAAYPGLPDAIEKIPGHAGVANVMRGADRQKFMQASSSLSEALLRAATGAGVNAHEAQQKVEELTPKFGEAESVTRQKMAAIPLYIESLKVRAGPGAPRAASIGAGQIGGADNSDPLGLRK